MKRMAALAASVVLGALALPAQDFTGSVEARMGWYWKSDALEPLTQILCGSVDGTIGPSDAPRAQYRVQGELDYDPSSNAGPVELDEAWIKAFVGPLDISLGNQVAAWSISDVVYPSDVANPWDESNPIDLKRMPVPMGRVVLNGSSFSLDLVGIPYWIGSLMPEAPWTPASMSALAALSHDSSKDQKPAFSWDAAGYGAHAKASLDLLQGLDLGATFYRGISYAPTGVDLVYSEPYPSGYYYVYDRETVIGADLTLVPGGGLLLKTEWDYTTLDNTDILDPGAGEASAEGVSGFEYTFGAAQLEGEYVLDWAKKSPGDSVGKQLIGVLTWNPSDRFDLKIAGSYDFDGSGFVSPELGCTIADGIRAECDLYFFFGAASTEYGAYSGNSLGRISLKCSF